MKREEKSGERLVAEKQEEEKGLRKKLSKVLILVGKRGEGPSCSTPVPAWRAELGKQDSTIKLPPTFPARKLAATLWEFSHYLHLANMYQGGNDPRFRHHHHHHFRKDKVRPDFRTFLNDPSTDSPEQPASASSLRRHVAASLMKYHRSIDRNNCSLQPVTPTSYGSSMEVAPYNPAATPSSSLDFKGRLGEASHSLKTSTELLKVLNRIWSLEEQHTYNISLIKALKKELVQARAKIKELLRDQQADRHEIDELMDQIAEEKLARKSKEHDRINAAVQSARDELEDERKLRKRSESLHRKLARELSELKPLFANALKELESERKSRKLLEDLCDEFAWGIRDYEQEIHSVRQKCDTDLTGVDDHDRSILPISESWLDERMQIRQGTDRSVVEKLGFEIESFLQAKRRGMAKNNKNLLQKNPRFTETQHVGYQEDSEGSDSHCFELNKPSNGELKPSNLTCEMNNGRNPANLQVKFKEKMAQVVSKEQGKTGEGATTEVENPQKSENCEKIDYGIQAENNDHAEPLSGKSGWRNHASPIQRWMTRLKSPNLEIPETSSKSTTGLKEDTLKDKLLEARKRGPRFRLKSSKRIDQ